MKTQQEIEQKINDLETVYYNQIRQYAAETFKTEIIPFLRARRLSFIAGMGTYCIITYKGRMLFLDDYNLKKFDGIKQILETVVDSMSFGAWMPDFNYNDYILKERVVKDES